MSLHRCSNALFFTTAKPMVYFARIGFDSLYTIVCLVVLSSAPVVSMSMHPIWLFVACTMLAIVGGQAALWKSEETITKRVIVSHLLNMGTCGGACSMLLYAILSPMPNLEWYILGVIGILSLGGLKMIDMVKGMAEATLKRLTKNGKA